MLILRASKECHRANQETESKDYLKWIRQASLVFIAAIAFLIGFKVAAWMGKRHLDTDAARSGKDYQMAERRDRFPGMRLSEGQHQRLRNLGHYGHAAKGTISQTVQDGAV